MDRATVSNVVEKQLHRFYGGKRCVVSSSLDHVDWHHLDDQPTNSTFENLIPLGRDFNLNLRDVRRTNGSGLKPELDPDMLQLSARQYFATDWNTGQAYGCARLAAFVASRYLGWDGSRLVKPITQALYYARTRLNYQLLGDILKRDLEPVVRASALSRDARFAVLSELASLFADHGYAREAVDLYVAADTVRPFRLLMNPIDAAAFFRRRAMTRGAADSSWLKAENEFAEALDIGGHGENLEVSVANSRAWALLDRSEPKKAYDLLLPLYRRYRKAAFTPTNVLRPVNVTGWNIAELMHSFSVAAAVGSRARAASQDAFTKAITAYQQLGAVPYLVRSGFWQPLETVRSDLQITTGLALPLRPKLPRGLVTTVQHIAHHVTHGAV